MFAVHHTLTPGDPRSVARARTLVCRELADVAVPLDDMLLATSELVTNAVVAAGGSVLLAVDVGELQACVAVYDDGPGTPAALPSTPHLAHGRGLAIVEVLSQAWGVEPAAPGKWVWAEFPVAVPARSGAA